MSHLIESDSFLILSGNIDERIDRAESPLSILSFEDTFNRSNDCSGVLFYSSLFFFFYICIFY